MIYNQYLFGPVLPKVWGPGPPNDTSTRSTNVHTSHQEKMLFWVNSTSLPATRIGPHALRPEDFQSE